MPKSDVDTYVESTPEVIAESLIEKLSEDYRIWDISFECLLHWDDPTIKNIILSEIRKSMRQCKEDLQADGDIK